jgi:methylthioxylose transferase
VPPYAPLVTATVAEGHSRVHERRVPTPVHSGRAVAAWATLVAAAFFLGAGVRADEHAHVGAAPFVGTWLPAWGWRVLPALVLGAAAVAWATALADRLPWRRLLAVAALGTVAWAVTLNVVDGSGALTAPVATRYEYLADVGRVGSPGPFLAGFVDQLPTYATHVKSHPPGLLLALWGLDRAGLGGPGAATALVLAGAAVAVVAALVALAEVAGQAAARRAAPFVALAPAAVFVATASDAVFAGVAAAGAALVVLATGRRRRRADLLAAGGGLVLGAALFLSYGAVLVLAVPVAVAVARRRLRPLVVAGAGVAVVAAAFAAFGFWWPAGLAATKALYHQGAAARRPYGYFLLANLAVFAVLVGPATAAGLARLRRAPRGLAVLVGAALAAVALADVSGLSKSEVERIWLPFVPWVALAGAALAITSRRGWLAAQLATGAALQVLLRSPW